MFTLKNSSIGILLILAIGLSAWSILLSNLGPTLIDTNSLKPDSFMQDVVVTILDKQGKLSLKLVTPKMIHYPLNDTTKIETPRVTLFKKINSPWYIDADFAKAIHGVNEIIFWSNVNIHHPADNENPKTSILTSSLTILPKKNIAQTNELVTFTQPDATIHGTGMIANLDL